MYRPLFILALFILTFPLRGAIPSYEQQIVETIQIQFGEETQGADQALDVIRSKMKTREGYPFSQVVFDSDLKTLSQDYEWVEPEIEVREAGLKMLIKVWEKPLIRSIRFQGNRTVKDSTLQKELDVPTGALFDKNSFQKAFRKLKAYYTKMGYFEAHVSYAAKKDPLLPEVDIEIEIFEGRSGRIKEIAYLGADEEETVELLDLMVTKKWNLFTSVFMNGGFYNDEMIQFDQYQVVTYFQNKGYPDVDVQIVVSDSKTPSWLNVCIKVDKGDRYYFGRVTHEGNRLFSDEAIRKLIYPAEGRIFSPDAIRDSVKNIQDAYGVKGHIEVLVEDDLNLRAEEPIYDLHFTIQEGTSYKVGLVKIFGNYYTQNQVILNEIVLKPGEIFNSLKLKYTEERLRNIGYFKKVNVYAVKTSKDSCLGSEYRDIHIEIEEGPTGNIGAFLGLSTTNDLFGGANITEKNFNIKGLLPENFKRNGLKGLKGGGEYAHLTATVGQKNNSYILSWTKPYFMETQWSFGFDIDRSFNGTLSDDYDIISYGSSLHGKRYLNAFLSTGVHTRLRHSFLEISEEAGSISSELRSQEGKQGTILGTGFSLIYNSTNHPIRPTNGFLSQFEAEYIGPWGAHHFATFSYCNTLYHPFGSQGYIKLRGDLKFIQPFDSPESEEERLATIPVDERLFLGGDTQVRGYRPFAIGPKFSDTKDPQGGLTLCFLSLEYDWRLFSRGDIFIFADAGSLSANPWNLGNLKCSIGYGLKLLLLEGAPPLVLGMGYPLNPESRSDVLRFFISFGAKF